MRTLPLAAAVATAAAAACVASPAPAAPDRAATQRVFVTLTEFKVLPAPGGATPGRVTFFARNSGRVPHELVVIRTDRKHGALPVARGRASERGAVGRIPALRTGRRGSVTLDLRPGGYVLICNLPGHYRAGQHAGFTVE